MPYNDGQSTLYFGPWYRKSPFFEATQRAGAKAYDIYNHMYLPGLYTDPFEEYWHLINHVTLWDVSVERQVEISGKDGTKFAELLTPRDLSTCKVGQGKYVVITDENGGIINDPVLIRLEKNRFWLSLANSEKKAGFVRKKALARIKKAGVKRKLAGIEIHGPQIHAWATEFWDVKKDGKNVGHLTALTYSPRLKKNIAYAWVPIRLAKLGTTLTVATSAVEREATVVKKPF